MTDLLRYQWAKLNTQQVGTFAEYFVKMELTMHTGDVYTSEIDDRGIDFVVRIGGRFLTIQVKSLRNHGYVFMQKTKFDLSDENWLALVLFSEGSSPDLFLIPSTVWLEPNDCFVDRQYDGLKSKPEWGLNVSLKNMEHLVPFRFETSLARILGSVD